MKAEDDEAIAEGVAEGLELRRVTDRLRAERDSRAERAIHDAEGNVVWVPAGPVTRES